MSRRKVIIKHAFRNALIPLMTVMALDTAYLFGGLIITERIFSISGMGGYFFDSLNYGDAPALLGWMLITAFFIIFFNLLADVMYGVLDPADPAVVTIAAPTEDSAELELAVTAEAVPRTQWQLFWRRFLHHRLAVFGLIMLIIVTIMCFFPGVFALGNHSGFDMATALSGAHGPTMKHWLGTDEQGDDFFYVLLKSGQISLKIGFLVAVFSTAFGVFVGATAGYFGKWVDGPLSALIDLFLVMPFLAVIAVLLQYEGHSAFWLIVALSLFGWTYVARISRGQVLALKEKEFVEAARASGVSSGRIIRRHMLPNMFGPIMVNLTLSVAYAIVTESTLTFLGFGIQAPQTSWGLLLSTNEGAINDTSKIHLLLFPGLMLLIVVLCVNFIGDGLRDAFDPQAKHTA